VLRQAGGPRRGTRPPHRGGATAIGDCREQPWLASTGVGQDNVGRGLAQRQLIAQAVCALAQGVHAPPPRRAALPESEGASFPTGGGAPPATGRQDVLTRQW
jgi:hypothetical protein